MKAAHQIRQTYENVSNLIRSKWIALTEPCHLVGNRVNILYKHIIRESFESGQSFESGRQNLSDIVTEILYNY